jgi:3-methyladenine DNA glycosylase AlkD
MFNEIIKKLEDHSDKQKAKDLLRFFKTGPGEYGEGDKFIGVKVPDQRKIAKQSTDADLKDIKKLITSPIHEHRLTALFIINLKYQTGDEDDRRELVELYLGHLDYVNNWDLVDSSAPYFFGQHLFDRNRKILYKLVGTNHLWSQRVAVMATFHFIKQNDFEDALRISKKLLKHKHDLIHKAVGWMLREIGNRDLDTELRFLDRYYIGMPRTMLRYAIEKFPEDLRQNYLRKGS